ncbi:hypothetical protein DK867_19130 [Ochrobactrum sp. POC9]|nr:hypothetical protein DK867_19130 [Ochrobactrum sp. POC9]
MPVCKWRLSTFRCSRTFLRCIALSEKSATFRGYAWKYAPLRYSKITIFASACRFLIQSLRPIMRRGSGLGACLFRSSLLRLSE